MATRLARAPIIDTGLGFRYYQYRPQSLPYAELEAHNIEWAKNIKPGDVVFDIGGNFGTISLLAASRGATTFAFETNIGVNGGVKLDHQGGVNLDHLGRCEARCFRLSR
mgnify:CR=1 FL=1